MTDRRRSFAPVVVVGLGAAVLTAVGSSRPLMSVESRDSGSAAFTTAMTLTFDGGQLPLATTLSMVVLAAWGVLLVSRGRVRTAVSVLGALASLGVLATVVAGWWLVPSSLRESLGDLGDLGDQGVDVVVSGWYWLTLVAAVVSAIVAVLAVVLLRAWPEIGTRYDRPSGGPPSATGVEDEDATDLELWKALDQGRDPTA